MEKKCIALLNDDTKLRKVTIQNDLKRFIDTVVFEKLLGIFVRKHENIYDSHFDFLNDESMYLL